MNNQWTEWNNHSLTIDTYLKKPMEWNSQLLMVDKNLKKPMEWNSHWLTIDMYYCEVVNNTGAHLLIELLKMMELSLNMMGLEKR